jgi:LacI family transcriptional regulator
MNIQRSSVTINRVAAHAGVSVGTVSRVLNGYANISPENLLRVQKAISSLGYQKRLPTLGSLKNKAGVRTGNIGLVYAEMGSGWMHHPLISSYTFGVEEACRERGFHALIELPGDSHLVPRCVREGKIDGLLVKATVHVPAFVQDIAEGLPVVGIGFNDPSAPIYQVAPDDRGAGWMVADYLWQRGHRRIAYVCTTAQHPMFVARFHGYESYLRGMQAYLPERVVMEDEKELRELNAKPQETPPNMSDTVDRLWSLDKDEIPTAIITANDWMASGLYAALAQRGIRVPDDVSVVGFDNSTTICGYMVPSLTSFDLCFSAIARAATLQLLDQIENPTRKVDPAIQLVRGCLIERESVRTLPEATDAIKSERQLLQI